MATRGLQLLQEATHWDSFSLVEERPESREPRMAGREQGGKENRAGAQGEEREKPGEEPGHGLFQSWSWVFAFAFSK